MWSFPRICVILQFKKSKRSKPHILCSVGFSTTTKIFPKWNISIWVFWMVSFSQAFCRKHPRKVLFSRNTCKSNRTPDKWRNCGVNDAVFCIMHVDRVHRFVPTEQSFDISHILRRSSDELKSERLPSPRQKHIHRLQLHQHQTTNWNIERLALQRLPIKDPILVILKCSVVWLNPTLGIGRIWITLWAGLHWNAKGLQNRQFSMNLTHETSLQIQLSTAMVARKHDTAMANTKWSAWWHNSNRWVIFILH